MRDHLDRREGGMSRGLMMLFAAAAVFALLLMWGPWSPRVVNRGTPDITVGSAAPTVQDIAPAATPAAPSTTR